MSRAVREVLEVLWGILVLVGIFVFAIYVLPWLEFAVYGIALTWLAVGLVVVAGVLVWRFIRWNWS
jgi:hypothetical protein